MNEVAFGEFDEENEEAQPNKGAASKKNQVVKVKSAPTPRITPRETLDFQLVRTGDGRLTELATPLLGLCARVRSTESYENVEELHSRVNNEIQNFSAELTAQGYDKATVQAARYCMCTMIDESVMGQPWGAESIWAENTMLSVYHNETWGGEKFFAILDRVINDVKRFPDLLELLYMCLLLGFEGKYHIARNGQSKLEHLMKQLNDILVEQQEGLPKPTLEPENNVVHNAKNIKKRFDFWQIILIALGVLIAIYLLFAFGLASKINEIGDQIRQTFQNILTKS